MIGEGGEHSGGIPRRWCLETQAERIVGKDAAQSVMSFWGQDHKPHTLVYKAPKPDLPPAALPS